MSEKPTYSELEQRIQKLEKALIKSKEKSQLLFKNLPAGFALHEIILDEHGNPYDYLFLEVNPAFEQLTGLKSEEIVGKTVRQALPNIESYWIETYGKVATTGEIISFEHHSQDLGKDYAVIAYAPEPGHFATIFTDITESIQYEKLNQQKNEFLKLVLDSLNHPFCVIDPTDYTITLSNLAARLDQVPNFSNCYELFHNRNTPCEPPEHPCPIEIIKKSKKPVTLEHIHYDKDGNPRNVELNAYPVFDSEGNISQIIEYSIDITDRKKAENELKITQFSVDHATIPIAWVGHNGRFLYVNDAYCRLFNYSRDEMLTMSVSDLDPNISLKKWPENFRKIKDKKISVFETSRLSKDGVAIPVQIQANYLAYGDNKFVISYCLDIREQKESERKIQEQFNRLAALRAIDMAIIGSFDIRITFSILLDQLSSNLGIDAAHIVLFNPHTYKLEHSASRGFRTDALRYTSLSIGEGYAGRVAKERQTICIPDLVQESQDLLFKQSPLIKHEKFVTYYGTPLVVKGNLKGVLEIFKRTPIKADQAWLDFLEALATQAAIAIDNAFLFDDLQKSNLELMMAYDSTLEGWSRALDLRDKETEGHSQRVTGMTVQIARKMGIRDSELVHVRRGALLHDIGKMGIPDSILHKPGALSDEEWEIMRRHPVYAYELLSPTEYLKPAIDIPYCHHEKWDGTGYPRGLKGNQIPLGARIFAIVDVWDACSSDRPYRPSWPEQKILKLIREQSGKHFDPEVVESFLDFLNEKKIKK